MAQGWRGEVARVLVQTLVVVPDRGTRDWYA